MCGKLSRPSKEAVDVLLCSDAEGDSLGAESGQKSKVGVFRSKLGKKVDGKGGAFPLTLFV